VKPLRFSKGITDRADRDEEIYTPPEIPENASAREVGIVLIGVVASLRDQFLKANRARDARDRRRFLALSGAITGLIIDIILSVVAFSLINANHDLVTELGRQQATISYQQAEIHSEQLLSCQNSNATRATAKSVWFGVLDQFNAPGVNAATRAFAQQAEVRIAKAYQPVDCSKAFRP
jgi:hypothetical protein